ncbi:MAG: DHH family phosphoesterase [Bacilli bacterium]
MKTFKDKLLAHFNLTDSEFARLSAAPSVDNLPSYKHFLGIELIVERITNALTKHEKIAVYGDYDCDGVMSTSIIVATFNKLNYPITYKLPSRYQDGYGLTVKAVEDFHAQQVNLIITVDNGISQVAAVERANELGIDVIVTDHHELLGELPKAYAIMHPIISGYGEVVSCGAYVALMLSRALLNYYDDYLVTLAGIATISDMMPLKEYNREIVKLANENMNRYKYINLMKLAEVNDVNESVIAMKIAPKINAIGRMTMGTELNILVEYITTNDMRRINDIYTWIYEINESRKETMKEAAANLDDINLDDAAIVMITEENEGMLGLLAARFVNTYTKPSIVFTYDTNEPHLLKGSARSRKGFNIGKAFTELSDLMIKFGGHELAGGCTINKDNFELFKTRFNQLAAIYSFEEQVEKVIDIDKSELNMNNYDVYRQLAPYGQAFELPLFRIKGFNTSELSYSRDGKHIIMMVNYGVKIVGFNIDNDYIKSHEVIDFIGSIGISEYKNYRDLNFTIQKIV